MRDHDLQGLLISFPLSALRARLLRSKQAYALFREKQWILNSDTVLSEATLRSTVANTLSTDAFDIWNVESDTTRVAYTLIRNALLNTKPQSSISALLGNSTSLDSGRVLLLAHSLAALQLCSMEHTVNG